MISPPFTITNAMMNYISSISEKIGKINTLKNLESKPYLRKNNRIKSIHSSLKIEANSLSLTEVRDIINGRQVLGEQKEIQEVKNAYLAYELLESINPYNINDFKKLHGIMTKYIIEDLGKFRRGEEGVFSGDTCIFIAPPARLVNELMYNLFNWLNAEKDNIHPLILSSVFHYELVFIHPFSDGNGKMARLWHTAILSKWKSIFACIPIESQIEKFQDDYYKSISASHSVGNSNIFIEFMLKQIDSILDEIVNRPFKDDINISEYINKLLNIMEYDIAYTSATLMEKLGIKSKDSFRKNYLNPAIKLNLINMTIPDKPTSKNQRYIKN